VFQDSGNDQLEKRGSARRGVRFAGTNLVGLGLYAQRWQAERDTAFAAAGCAKGAKAPSSLRSAGALEMAVPARCALLKNSHKKTAKKPC